MDLCPNVTRAAVKSSTINLCLSHGQISDGDFKYTLKKKNKSVDSWSLLGEFVQSPEVYGTLLNNSLNAISRLWK